MYRVTLPPAVPLLVLSGLYLISLGCGGLPSGKLPLPAPTNASAGAVSVSISPQTAALGAGNSLQFTATSSGPPTADLEWLADGVPGGNSASGTISRSGLYTAPQQVTSNATIVIAVSNKTTPTKTSSATVTVLSGLAPITVSLAPGVASLNPSQTQQFTATVKGTTNQGVSWFVNGNEGGNSSVGTISSTGTYTAPLSAPAVPSVTITAMSTYDTASSATAAVTIIPGAPSGSPQPVASSGVNNVQAYGATVNTGTDSTAAINKAVTACPNQSCTVYLPAGTYALKNRLTPIVINQPHITFVCAQGVILQAQTGFISPNWPELDIQGSASDVTVQGCVFDGNNISGRGAQVDSTAANIYLDHIEVKNQTQYAVVGAFRTGGLWQVTNSYFHNTPALYDLAGNGGAPSLRVDNNRFDSITGIMAGASGITSYEASGNQFTNSLVGGVEGALYCFGCDQVIWQENHFDNVGAALHCDTCGGGTISSNTATNDYGVGIPDFFVEVGSHFTIEGNVSTNKTGERGLVAGVGSGSQGPASLRTQINSFDSITGFTAGSNVNLSTDTKDKQEGTGSMVATANGSFTSGMFWYFNFSSPQTFWLPFQDIWIEPTSGGLAAGQLQLCFSVNTSVSTCDLPVNLPAVAQNTWYHVIQYATGWEGALQINGQSQSGFKSYGIKVTTNSPSLAVKFDDLDRADELLGYIVRSNNIVNPASTCIGFGALQGGVIEDNYCENPAGGSDAGYDDENSADVEFYNNKSNFSVRPGSIHLIVDAAVSAANVQVSGDDTNAATEYSLRHGGQVTQATNP